MKGFCESSLSRHLNEKEKAERGSFEFQSCFERFLSVRKIQSSEMSPLSPPHGFLLALIHFWTPALCDVTNTQIVCNKSKMLAPPLYIIFMWKGQQRTSFSCPEVVSLQDAANGWLYMLFAPQRL